MATTKQGKCKKELIKKVKGDIENLETWMRKEIDLVEQFGKEKKAEVERFRDSKSSVIKDIEETIARKKEYLKKIKKRD